MAYVQGISFRNTDGYVTDGADEDSEINGGASPNYPHTTSQGNDVGWEVVGGTIDAVNQNAGIDVRLAGAASKTNTDIDTYRFDLDETGDHDIELGFGDYDYSTDSQVEVFDTTTTRGVLANGASSSQEYRDAANTLHTSPANWASNQAAVTVTMTTTIMRFDIGDGTGGDWSINHIHIAGPTLTTDQKYHRFYADGTESGSTALAAQDADITIGSETTFQLRMGMQASGDAPTQTATLQYRPTGVGDWIDVVDE